MGVFSGHCETSRRIVDSSSGDPATLGTGGNIFLRPKTSGIEKVLCARDPRDVEDSLKRILLIDGKCFRESLDCFMLGARRVRARGRDV